MKPTIAKWLPGLFCLNERAVYLGTWKYGFFSYAAVGKLAQMYFTINESTAILSSGATNVGTVKVYCDKNLHTNHPKNTGRCKDFCLGNNVELKKGDPFGEFRMGSTIVLVFEAPVGFQFTVLPGDHVKMGQSLGKIEHQKFVDRIQTSSKDIPKAS